MDPINRAASVLRTAANSDCASLMAGLGLGLLLAVAVAGNADAADAPAAIGEPVNRYAPGADVYGLFNDGEIHPWHVKGKVWLLAGEPGESNVVALVGDEGVLVVDTGVKSMAPKLLEKIRQLAEQGGGAQKAVRLIINTNGLADHIGGNEVVRAGGKRIIAGEEAATANAFGDGGAAVWAHQNVLSRLVDETAAKGANAPTEMQWPSDAVDQAVYGMYFTDEAVQMLHAPRSTTDGQMMVVFRQADVIVAGDVLNMTSYPTIDVARGGTIDGELIALNKLMDMIVPDDQVSGGTTVIPGHGRLTDLGDVARYTVVITTIRNRVQFYKNQGKTLEQVLALNPSAEYDDRWSAKAGPGSARDFLTAVYNTLPRKGPVFFSMETVTTVPATGPDDAKRRF
jgi:cyclase